jgi:hypothetical protein
VTAALILVSCGASTAPAAPELTVTNVAQLGYESVPALAPVSAADRGPCEQPLTAEQANGAAGPCGAGAWPAMGSFWSPDWLTVGGGDRLLLHLDPVPDEVRYSVMTNYAPGFAIPGMVAPPGGGPGTPPIPLANAAFVAPAAAIAPTPELADWSLVLPTLQQTPSLGMNLSVTARTGTAWSSYAVGLSMPRLLDPSAPCPTAFYNPGQTRPQTCSGFTKAPPPGFGPSGPLAPIMLSPSELTAATLVTRPRLRGRTLSATIKAAVPGTATVTLSRTAAHAKALGRAQRTLRARTTPIHLTVPAAARRRLLAGRARRIASKIVFKPRAAGASLTVAGTFAIPLAARRRAS